MVTQFEDRFKTGEIHGLPLNHALANTDFPARALELEAIQTWARSQGITLRSEACLHTQKENEKVILAQVITYDYKPQNKRYEIPTKTTWAVGTKPAF